MKIMSLEHVIIILLVLGLIALAVFHYHTQIVAFVTKEKDAALAELNQIKGRFSHVAPVAPPAPASPPAPPAAPGS